MFSRPVELFAVLGLISLLTFSPDEMILSDDSVPVADEQTDETTTERELFTGKVVLLKDALAERDLRVAEEMADQAVLETPEGDLIPILADWRGRAFFQDERLRDRKVELVAYRREHLPYLQVLMVFTFDEDGTRQYTDYWCDVCSIPMYEIKACECCQGDIRLRFQPQDLPNYLHLSDSTE
ncbi:MAG: hypothetical protein KDA93_14965 [Planctomycetaceae bacterium]|nr:hypothetical protein [Planctomycetaceae bacterium]